jgi:hypothetical protein
MNKRSPEEKSDYFKNLIYDTVLNLPKERLFLELGSKKFYELSAVAREHIYRTVFLETQNNYPILERLTRGLEFTLKFCTKSQNQNLYADYLNYRFTSKDVSLLFYYCKSGLSSREVRSFAYDKILKEAGNRIIKDAIQFTTAEQVEGELKTIRV